MAPASPISRACSVARLERAPAASALASIVELVRSRPTSNGMPPSLATVAPYAAWTRAMSASTTAAWRCVSASPPLASGSRSATSGLMPLYLAISLTFASESPLSVAIRETASSLTRDDSERSWKTSILNGPALAMAVRLCFASVGSALLPVERVRSKSVTYSCAWSVPAPRSATRPMAIASWLAGPLLASTCNVLAAAVRPSSVLPFERTVTSGMMAPALTITTGAPGWSLARACRSCAARCTTPASS